MKHRVIIALGTNVQQTIHLQEAILRLSEFMDYTDKSRALWTLPIGISSDRFLNQIVYGHTSLTLHQLTETIKLIERHMGRTPEKKSHGQIDIDIDILKYDDQQLHASDWTRDYIQTLMREMADA